jgi:preprotein translocase subunit SecE
VAGRLRAATVLARGRVLGERAPCAANRSEVMVNPFTFIQEVRAEAKKVTWPSRRETMVTTGLVIVMVVLSSLFFVVVDSAFRFLVKLILGGAQ